VLLALDGEIVLQGTKKSPERIHLGDFLPVSQEMLTGRLITDVILPNNIQAAYLYSARSPADLPIVAAATAKWPSGRTRVVLAGYGEQPRMVFDGPDHQGAVIAARDAYSDAADQWASAEYRSDTAGVLVQRCLDNISEVD
jgi:CO/xanthine dehydrogenase FAD-binding subunit